MAFYMKISLVIFLKIYNASKCLNICPVNLKSTTLSTRPPIAFDKEHIGIMLRIPVPTDPI
jgi:hypothetical protein